MRRFMTGLMIVIFSVFCISCVGPKVAIKNQTVYEQPVPELASSYLLGPGDVIEITYLIDSQLSEPEYVLAVGDKILVDFHYHPESRREVEIRPDGKITLPVKGEISAAGFTPDQLRKRITDIYSSIYRNPVVTVTLLKCNTPTTQLKEAITTAPLGQTKTITVRPDGYISFPLIEDIKAAGISLPQLQAEALSRYKTHTNNLNISLVLQNAKSNLAYVMGEVRKPDSYLMESPTTLTQILARAGGPLDTAALDSIVVVSRDAESKPVGRVIDVEKILAEANIGRDILLRQYDIVYVPKTGIAKAGVFVDQYINKIVPQAIRGGFNAVYRINDDNGGTAFPVGE